MAGAADKAAIEAIATVLINLVISISNPESVSRNLRFRYVKLEVNSTPRLREGRFWQQTTDWQKYNVLRVTRAGFVLKWHRNRASGGFQKAPTICRWPLLPALHH